MTLDAPGRLERLMAAGELADGIGSEEEVAAKVRAFEEQGVDRLIVSPVHGAPDERLHTTKRLAEMVGAGVAS